MALKQCHECGSQVSTEAKSCPNCGAPVKDQNAEFAKQVLAGIAGIGIVWMVLAASCSSDESEKEVADKKEAAAQAAPEPKPVECKADDLQCLGDKGTITAGLFCPDKIERLAKHSVKWTDGFFETKFSHFRWRNKEKGEITYIGDKVQFQNGFGAFTNMVYECDIAADNETVMAVRVKDGML